jgi:3-oxoacyl-ACP reductase-like protein
MSARLPTRFIQLLSELMDCPNGALRGAATDVLIEVVSKRMEPTAKINLVQQLKVVDACERLSSNLVTAAGAGKAGAAAGGSQARAAAAAAAAGTVSNGQPSWEQREDLLTKYAKLLATLAGEVMDALKRVENGEGPFGAALRCLLPLMVCQ